MILYYSALLLVAAVIAATLGFVLLSGTGSWIPRVLFVVFMVLFVISLARRKRSQPHAPHEDPPG